MNWYMLVCVDAAEERQPQALALYGGINYVQTDQDQVEMVRSYSNCLTFFLKPFLC